MFSIDIAPHQQDLTNDAVNYALWEERCQPQLLDAIGGFFAVNIAKFLKVHVYRDLLITLYSDMKSEKNFTATDEHCKQLKFKG
jgi:hypothetical protein